MTAVMTAQTAILLPALSVPQIEVEDRVRQAQSYTEPRKYDILSSAAAFRRTIMS